MLDLRYSQHLLRAKQAGRGVVFSEYPLWFALFFALFIAISEPIFGFTLRNVMVLKHIPLIIFVPGFAFYLVCRKLVRAHPISMTGWFECLWPFLLLGLFAIIGSIYARLVLDTRESFLVLGLYILLTPLFFLWGREVDNTNRVVRPFLLLWGLASCVAAVGAAVYFSKSQVLHNIEFLVQPFFLYLFFSQKTALARGFGLALILIVAVLTQKLTGYLNGIFALSYILIFSVNTPSSTNGKLVRRTFGAIAVLCILVLSTVAFLRFRQYLPSGNVEVRLHQYENVFTDFLRSPLWGYAYTAPSGGVYVENTRSLNIPTHSDILDLLKQGGLIAFGLWLYGISAATRVFIRCATSNTKTSAFFHAIAFITISTAMNCAVNPLLLTPVHAFIIWGVLALGLAVATDRREGQFNA